MISEQHRCSGRGDDGVLSCMIEPVSRVHNIADLSLGSCVASETCRLCDLFAEALAGVSFSARQQFITLSAHALWYELMHGTAALLGYECRKWIRRWIIQIERAKYEQGHCGRACAGIKSKEWEMHRSRRVKRDKTQMYLPSPSSRSRPIPFVPYHTQSHKQNCAKMASYTKLRNDQNNSKRYRQMFPASQVPLGTRLARANQTH